MPHVYNEPAWILFSRNYRETSKLLEVLTIHSGRISLIARGVSGKPNARKGLLQPFTPLSVSWSGKNEPFTLTQVELQGQPLILTQQNLWCGLYINELIYKLIHKGQGGDHFFEIYAHAIAMLANVEKTSALNEGREKNKEVVLRQFEIEFLNWLGLSFSFTHTVNDEPISPHEFYQFVRENGFVLCDESMAKKLLCFQGDALLAISQNNWNLEALNAAKKIMRLVYGEILNHTTLHSRSFYPT